MKFIKSFLFVLVITFFTACDNEPIDPALNLQIYSDTFSANLNGAVFSNPTIAVSEVTVGTQTFISIAGFRTNDRINVNILETTGVGNYPITGANTDVVQGFYSITSPVYNQRASIGLVTIIEKTATRIKGTFNFTTPNTPIPYIITSGNFDVELP